ncbi:hypothetical protein GNI_165250 [Gregarina niphandrodes]|uniref:Uncharacterized protein n=1 Tax=Gregarina niphandrodes TaxID=110365 RepID=A0A023AYR8_GRENI|nr:hypothetical protein GNI_165250 [Gregarina niphandrodes]EZG43598.1 hypothetical protein GNI_165250 [Gregarina niphandrodes]|eukprot:XP_011133176.1 hypothetical protein GNI_165250 [Gregarina niphandrodes]
MDDRARLEPPLPMGSGITSILDGGKELELSSRSDRWQVLPAKNRLRDQKAANQKVSAFLVLAPRAGNKQEGDRMIIVKQNAQGDQEATVQSLPPLDVLNQMVTEALSQDQDRQPTKSFDKKRKRLGHSVTSTNGTTTTGTTTNGTTTTSDIQKQLQDAEDVDLLPVEITEAEKVGTKTALVTEDGVTEDGVTEDGVTEDGVTEDGVTEKDQNPVDDDDMTTRREVRPPTKSDLHLLELLNLAHREFEPSSPVDVERLDQLVDALVIEFLDPTGVGASPGDGETTAEGEIDYALDEAAYNDTDTPAPPDGPQFVPLPGVEDLAQRPPSKVPGVVLVREQEDQDALRPEDI